ncbi:hypothetical protein [Yersinia kristensenii]|uniref:hypothetical protein n=1 Tax=Yersinia kristensenii TaxID=28152 RepID=UPI001C60B779|nr:hypothetical protein [Yersinia kristensenii]MBW5829156.1 hypothetical protein [Yersinia kristensenii]
MNTDNEVQAAFFKRLEKITAKEFSKFLDTKGVTTTCPMCNSDGEQVFDETNHSTMADLFEGQSGQTFVTYFHHKPANPGDSDANYYYKMTCENCGYITTYGVTPVLKWFDSLQSKDVESEK